MGISEIRRRCDHMRSRVRRLNPRARGSLVMPGYEFSSATVMRHVAQANYSKRFRAAYAPNCSILDAPHRMSGTKSLAPSTVRRHDAELQIAVASVQERTCGDFSSPSPIQASSESDRLNLTTRFVIMSDRNTRKCCNNGKGSI